MTHDELLAKIEATIDVEYFKESWLALLALIYKYHTRNECLGGW